MKKRRHHNHHALTQAKRGWTEGQTKEIAKRLKIPYNPKVPHINKIAKKIVPDAEKEIS